MKTYAKGIMAVAIFMIALPMQIQAAQFDAPYYDLAKKNKKQWAK